MDNPNRLAVLIQLLDASNLNPTACCLGNMGVSTCPEMYSDWTISNNAVFALRRVDFFETQISHKELYTAMNIE